MANPARPSFDEVIAESWGDSVSDTVVRRYPTGAARDTDLSGFTATALRGQVCWLDFPAGLQFHNGTKWLGVERAIDRVTVPNVTATTITAPAGTYPAGHAWRLVFSGYLNPTAAASVWNVGVNRTAPSAEGLGGVAVGATGGVGWPVPCSFEVYDPGTSAMTNPAWTISSTPAGGPLTGALVLYSMGPIPPEVVA